MIPYGSASRAMASIPPPSQRGSVAWRRAGSQADTPPAIHNPITASAGKSKRP